MAQLKVIKNDRPTGQKKGGSRSREQSLKYAFGELGERAVAFSSIGCAGATWQDFDAAFAATCAAHKKKPQIEVYHLEESYSKEEANPDDPEDVERVNALGRRFARRAWPGRQVVIVTQRDGQSGLLHNHVLVNNPDTITGRMCRGDDMTWERLMPLHDEVLAEHGHQQPAIMPTTVPEAKARARQSREATYAEGETLLRALLADSLEAPGPVDLEGAQQRAVEHGFELIDEPKAVRAKTRTRDKSGMRMRVRFTGSDARKHAFDVARTSLTREDVLRALAENAKAQQERFAAPPPRPAKPLITRYDPIFGTMPDRMAMGLARYSDEEIEALVAQHKAKQTKPSLPAVEQVREPARRAEPVPEPKRSRRPVETVEKPSEVPAPVTVSEPAPRPVVVPAMLRDPADDQDEVEERKRAAVAEQVASAARKPPALKPPGPKKLSKAEQFVRAWDEQHAQEDEHESAAPGFGE